MAKRGNNKDSYDNLVQELQLADREFYFRILHPTICRKGRDNCEPPQHVSGKRGASGCHLRHY